MTPPRLEDLWVPLRRRLSRLRAANREFDVFLQGLSYVPRPSEVPTSPRDFIICGSPRTGTTLAAAQLFQPPTVTTVMEPWDGLRFPPHALFASLREELAQGVLRRGRLDVAALRTDGRVAWTHEGTPFELDPTSSELLVGIKWPAWWQYLDALPDTKFIVCLRHPFEVLDSYRRTGGRLREGSDHPVAMNRAVNARVRASGRSLAVRRATLYETINRYVLGYLDRPNVYPLRYERWRSESDALREEMSDFLNTDLGPWPAKFRPSEPVAVGRRTKEIVRRHVPVARQLGYLT